jgi:hypothetical protein
MNTLKNSLAISMVIAIGLFTSGCLDDGKLSVIEYNNEVVDTLNTTSDIIEITTETYDVSVPNIVTEDAEIDTVAMQTAYDEAMANSLLAENVSLLVSRSPEQQTAVLAEFTTYLTYANDYLETYADMIDYYESAYFLEDLEGVAIYDELLHLQYNDFIDSNNSLVDILAEHIE